MQTLMLEFSRKTERGTSKLNRKTVWFDSDNNSFVNIDGGELVMEWNTEKRKFTPKMKWDPKKKKMDYVVKDIEQVSWQKSDNSEAVKKWVKQYGRRFDVEVNREESSNVGIAIDVDDKQVDGVTDSLEEHRIRYSELT